MSEIDSPCRTEALEHVSQALILLEKVRIRWRRYGDTTPLANSAAPIEVMLRTAKNVLSRPTDAERAETAQMLLGAVTAMRQIERDELRLVIEQTQAAHKAVINRQSSHTH
jgi:hypothetical protein